MNAAVTTPAIDTPQSRSVIVGSEIIDSYRQYGKGWAQLCQFQTIKIRI